MLPQQRVAAALRIEERPVKSALDFQQHAAGDQRRKSEDDHRRGHQHVPDIERHEIDAHPRRPGLERADDHLDGGGDGGDFDERKSQQPDIRADVGLIIRSERRIHEPAAARRGVEEDRPAKKHAAEQKTPEAECRKTRKRQVARAEHLRQKQYRDRLEDRNREQETSSPSHER